MTLTTKDDIARSIGPQSDFLVSEILRTGASCQEWRSAVAFVARQTKARPTMTDDLSPRLLRLVDLIAAAELSAQSDYCDVGPLIPEPLPGG